jgi:sensor c-di-GMP phosphodiesterase-like protein
MIARYYLKHTQTKIVLKKIYTLAEDLAMKVIPEGVETEA